MHKTCHLQLLLHTLVLGIEKLHMAQYKESYAACLLCHAYRKMLPAWEQHALV